MLLLGVTCSARSAPTSLMSASILPPDPTPSTGGANVLLDRRLELHPSPEDAAAESAADADGDAPATERDPLLGRGREQGRKRSDRSRSASVRRKKPWYRRPHPIWFVPSPLSRLPLHIYVS